MVAKVDLQFQTALPIAEKPLFRQYDAACDKGTNVSDVISVATY
jgi:hypothetical protein